MRLAHSLGLPLGTLVPLKLIFQIPNTTFLHFWFEVKSFQGLNSWDIQTHTLYVCVPPARSFFFSPSLPSIHAYILHVYTYVYMYVYTCVYIYRYWHACCLSSASWLKDWRLTIFFNARVCLLSQRQVWRIFFAGRASLLHLFKSKESLRCFFLPHRSESVCSI